MRARCAPEYDRRLDLVAPAELADAVAASARESFAPTEVRVRHTVDNEQ
jgi:hypothetical protein